MEALAPFVFVVLFQSRDDGLEQCLESNDTEKARYKLSNRLHKGWESFVELSSTDGFTTGDMSTTHLSCACCIESIRTLNPKAKVCVHAARRFKTKRKRDDLLQRKEKKRVTNTVITEWSVESGGRAQQKPLKLFFKYVFRL